MSLLDDITLKDVEESYIGKTGIKSIDKIYETIINNPTLLADEDFQFSLKCLDEYTMRYCGAVDEVIAAEESMNEIRVDVLEVAKDIKSIIKNKV